MELETKPIARDSLRGLIDATRDVGRPHAHVIRRRQARQARQHVATVREPSALRGLVLLVAIALVVRVFVVWVF